MLCFMFMGFSIKTYFLNRNFNKTLKCGIKLAALYLCYMKPKTIIGNQSLHTQTLYYSVQGHHKLGRAQHASDASNITYLTKYVRLLIF